MKSLFGRATGDIIASRNRAKGMKKKQGLSESEKCLEQFQRVARLGYYTLDVNSGEWTSSEMMDELLGIEKGYKRDRDGWINIIHPDYRQEASSYLVDNVLNGGKDFDREFKIIRKRDNAELWVHVLGELEKNEDGKPVKLFGTVQDITTHKRVEEELRNSRERFRLLHEHAPIGIILANRLGQILEVNPASLEILGSPSADRTKEINILTFPRLVDAGISAAFQRCVETARPNISEYTYVTKWEKPIHVELHFVPILDSAEQVALVHLILEDVTEHKKAEEALRLSEEKYRAMFENVQDVIYMTDLEGRLTDVSPSIERHSGYTRDEVIGKPATIFYEDPSERLGFFRAIQEKGEVIDYITRFRTKSGRIIHVLLNAHLTYDSDGKPCGVEGIIHDITERKRTETALRESEEKFRALVEGLTAAISINDGKRFFYANPAAEKMLGYTADEISQLAASDVIHPDYRELVMMRSVQRLRGKSFLKHYECQLITKDGKAIWVDFSATLIKYNGVPALITSAYDISDRKKLEEQLLQAQKMEGIGRLAGGVAHDYNNMLGVIIGYSDLVLDKMKEDDPLYQYTKLISSAAKRGADITRQLLAFARREIVSPRVLSPNTIIESLRKIMVRLIGENVEFVFLPAQDVWNIKIDPTQLDQILVNLATNARDAIDDVGTITLETSNVSIDEAYAQNRIDFSPGEYVVISFTDTGKGMSKETMNNIFEPFFTTKPKGEGTGLGLSTVYGIVKQNGGSINVYSEIGSGTTFKIFLPRYYGEVEKPSFADVNDTQGGNATILIVEDQAELLELTRRILERSGYRVLTALSPDEAVLLCETWKEEIDLLLTDVVMPLMNGKELLQKLETVKPGIKSIFMSGYTSDVIAQRGVLDKGVNFIQKPFTPSALAKKVHDALKA